MTHALPDLAQQLLDAAKAAGADAADTLVTEGFQTSVDVRDAKLEEAQRAEGVDFGLRVIIGTRQAVVSSMDARPDTIRAMAERAVAMAREAPEDPSVGLADPSLLATEVPDLDLADDAGDPSPDVLRDMALAAEAAARGVDGITKTDSAGAGASRRHIHLAGTNGLSAGYERTSRSLSVVAIAGTGTAMERDWAFDGRTHLSDLDPPEEIGRLAAERTLARRAPRRPRTGTYPVLYDERVAAGLIGHLVAAINGMMIARGSSWAKDLMGASVLPDGLSLTERPLRPRVTGSRPLDAEGLATREAPLVEDGVLGRWVLDLSTARRLGLKSTGNAARGTSTPPSPSVTNLHLTAGTANRDDLIAQMGTGLLVTSLIGSTINPNTGDYSRGASGIWYEKGAPVHAVSEVTIAGNLRDMLRTIVPANDARSYASHVVPSLLVPSMTIAGE
ncbi:microcin-processing peptidase 1 [Hasllibacter halocynthiae]|uniref:Microcin-processing peptidase 1 n=1 Tax=Hasllibacter halocynthiae TaxID=595589 RepID=A0A2T0X1G0_9RHOB|nr:TldD/PmbA family protein [Hasllibacter halocynthiae]PRY92793.1 microcin-processing peptidase 1 [Hasllibacter halocynthiae]